MRYVVFAERARMVTSADDVSKVAVSDRAAGRSHAACCYQGATNLERALDQALLGLDPDRVKRLVLFTDGNQTEGDLWRALPRLKAQGGAGVRLSPPRRSTRVPTRGSRAIDAARRRAGATNRSTVTRARGKPTAARARVCGC